MSGVATRQMGSFSSGLGNWVDLKHPLSKKLYFLNICSAKYDYKSNRTTSL